MKNILTSGILFALLICLGGCALNPKVYFSPNGGCQDAVISQIRNAQKTIDIAMYELTSREIAQELVKAHDRMIIIRVVLDNRQESQTYSKSRYLIKRRIDVRYHIGAGIMHNKFAIIDGKVLLTGSFNWTAGAEYKNEENLLIMTDKGLIKKYEDRFEYLWKSSEKDPIGQNQSNHGSKYE